MTRPKPLLDSARVRTRRFGDTDLEASEIGFGTWALGSTLVGRRQRILRRAPDLSEALDLGITFFETGDAYGQGANEELVGRVLAPHRDEIQLSTKFGYVLDSDRQQHSEGERPQRWDGAFVREALEGSLRRLGTDRVDLYQLHNPRMDAIDTDDCFATLEDLRSEGKIRHYGVALGPAIGWRDEGLAGHRHPRHRLGPDRLQPARAGSRARPDGGGRRARRRRHGAGTDLLRAARRQPDPGHDLRPRRPPAPSASRMARRGTSEDRPDPVPVRAGVRPHDGARRRCGSSSRSRR